MPKENIKKCTVTVNTNVLYNQAKWLLKPSEYDDIRTFT